MKKDNKILGFFLSGKSRRRYEWKQGLHEKGQVATEYLLLLALGLLIVIIGVTVALQLKTLSDFVAARTAVERNATMAMLLK